MAQFTNQTLTVSADQKFRLDAIIIAGANPVHSLTIDGVALQGAATSTSFIYNRAILQGATVVIPTGGLVIGEFVNTDIAPKQ